MAETLTVIAPKTFPLETLALANIVVYSNQQLIDAFFDAANKINAGDYQGLLAKAGLDVDQLAADRAGRYGGPPLAQLPQLSGDERQLIHQGLLRQLQRRAQPARISAPAGANLRSSPGRQQPLVVSLPLGTDLTILAETIVEGDGNWLLVTADEQSGWLFADLVERNPTFVTGASITGASNNVNGTSGGNTAITPPLTFTGSLTPSKVLTVPAGATPAVAGAANTWNQYGGLIEAECQRLNFDPAVAVAILGVESAWQAFIDGRMVIRFENHIFLQNWGQAHRDLFDQHFTGSNDGNQHFWKPAANGEWQRCHTNQAVEWQVFDFARGLDETAAMLSISMGTAQIMGFNYDKVGYPSVQAMFNAFQADVRHQLIALFRFIEFYHLEDEVRIPNFVAFAHTYNGSGQEADYAAKMQRYYDAYHQLVATRDAVRRLPQPAGPAHFNLDPELMAAWRKYAENGLANNQVMFQQLLDAFMIPYWTTVWMYRILFGLGIASFLVAAGLSAFTDKLGFVLVFGGFSALSLLAYFLNRPLQALEENLNFITWLGLIYNTYWSRLLYLNSLPDVQQGIQDVTDDAIHRIKELMAAQAKRSSRRPNLPGQ
jgi:hypothetical protein